MRIRAKEGWHVDKRHLFQAVKTANACPLSGIFHRQNHRDALLFGVMTCDNREYSERARLLSLKGAELILVPKNCGPMRPEPMKTCLGANGESAGQKRAAPAPSHRIAGIKRAAAL